MMYLKEWIELHQLWAERTFPAQTLPGIVSHIRKELDEVEHATSYENLLEEIADATTLVIRMGTLAGFTFEEVFEQMRKKFLINMKRSWEPQPDGDYTHTEE